MSKETIQWLNANTLVGFTTDRDKYAGNGFLIDGRPWWQIDGYQGGFEGPIPVQAVLDRLFYWEATEGDLTVRIPVDDAEDMDGIADDGSMYRNMIVPGRKAIIRPDTEEVLGVFMSGYQVHQYHEWLIENVHSIVDDSEAGIATAGLLRGGAQAYVSIELPEAVTTASGFPLRSNIIAMTSMNGSLATTYKAGAHAPVCDNSLAWFTGGEANRIKIKHSSNSLRRIGSVRDALGILYSTTEQMVEFLDRCAETTVTDDQWRQVVAAIVQPPDPQPNGKGGLVNQRAVTIAGNKVDELWDLYKRDKRVGNLTGTLAGVYQAANTWNEHFRTRNDNGVERVMQGVVDGSSDQFDREFWRIVDQVGVRVPELEVAA